MVGNDLVQVAESFDCLPEPVCPASQWPVRPEIGQGVTLWFAASG
jgi:hypothetical protein